MRRTKSLESFDTLSVNMQTKLVDMRIYAMNNIYNPDDTLNTVSPEHNSEQVLRERSLTIVYAICLVNDEKVHTLTMHRTRQCLVSPYLISNVMYLLGMGSLDSIAPRNLEVDGDCTVRIVQPLT